MHPSMVCPTTPTWGKYGDNVGDMQNQAHPIGARGIVMPTNQVLVNNLEANTMGEGQEIN